MKTKGKRKPVKLTTAFWDTGALAAVELLICLPTVNARESNPTLKSCVFTGSKRTYNHTFVWANPALPVSHADPNFNVDRHCRLI
jgi:hypothetical protein